MLHRLHDFPIPQCTAGFRRCGHHQCDSILFGPIIGAVPSTLLILIESPIKALWFVVFVLALQQLDGNVIGPKILGDRTGLSSFWVLFTIILFGGLWGVFGMVIGVPLFGVIYDTVKKLVRRGLDKKGSDRGLGAVQGRLSRRRTEEIISCDHCAAVKLSRRRF